MAGYGPQKLATLAAFALRRNLLDWLETFKVEKLCAERMRARGLLLKVCAVPLKVTTRSLPLSHFYGRVYLGIASPLGLHETEQQSSVK